MCAVLCLVLFAASAAVGLAQAAAPVARRVAGGVIALTLASLPLVTALPPKVDPKVPATVRHVVQDMQKRDQLGWALRLTGSVERNACTMVSNQTPRITRAAVLGACQRTEAAREATSQLTAKLTRQLKDARGIPVPPVRPRQPLPPVSLPVRFDTGCMANSMGPRYCGFFASGAGGIEGMGANWTAFITRGNQTFVYGPKTIATVLSDAIVRGDYVFLDAGPYSMPPSVVRAGPDVGLRTLS